jgi:hypothetical protein
LSKGSLEEDKGGEAWIEEDWDSNVRNIDDSSDEGFMV